VPTAAYAAIKEGLAYTACRDLAGSLERQAQLQAWLAETHDHRAATPPCARKKQPAYLGR
jgi:2-(1,2-epoxy-1,2-dihydrophenyl)acetyl-CoA isomerase